MVGWSRRMQNTSYREWQRRREDELHIRQALGLEIMPDDLSGMRPEFLRRLLGKEKAREYLLNEHVEHVTWRAAQWRTLRCVLFGCSPRDTCPEWDECTACPGACKRCKKPVLAKARALR